MNPEIYEDALVPELQARLGTSYWNVRATRFDEAGPQDVVVHFRGTEVDAQVHGDNPNSAVLGPDLGEVALEVDFVSAANPARDVFSGVYSALKKSCRQLTGTREGEIWTIERFDELDVNAEAEAPVRIWKATLTVSLLLQE